MIHFSKGGDAPSIEPRSLSDLRAPSRERPTSSRCRCGTLAAGASQVRQAPGYRVAAIVAGASLIAGTVAAEPPPASREPIVIDSVVATIDDTTNTADFTTISVTQGSTRITAERAHATDVDSKNSRWTFTGRVMITSEQRGSLWADQAILEYRDGALDQILATGAPVRFEQRRTDSERGDRGQADEITYEAKQATVRLRGHPQISEGSGLEMSAPMFLYHVRDGKLQAYSDNGTRAVHIITKPTGSLVP